MSTLRTKRFCHDHQEQQDINFVKQTTAASESVARSRIAYVRPKVNLK